MQLVQALPWAAEQGPAQALAQARVLEQVLALQSEPVLLLALALVPV